MTENQIGDLIVASATKVHSGLGPGLLENTYQVCLAHELSQQHLTVRRQAPIAIRYDTLEIENAYRIDLPVENSVAIELKAVESILPIHRGQLLSYLRLGNFNLGYLLIFHTEHMRDGIKRLVNGL